MIRRVLLIASVAAPLAIAGCASAPPTVPPVPVVFFTPDSAMLDPAAQNVIKQAAADARATPGARVHVRGFAAPDAGSTAFNASLSRTRAQAVADALANAGVAPSRISIESRGAVSYELIPTESRRVEILVGP